MQRADILDELVKSQKVFAEKLNHLSRRLAWINATIYSKVLYNLLSTHSVLPSAIWMCFCSSQRRQNEYCVLSVPQNKEQKQTNDFHWLNSIKCDWKHNITHELR